MNIKVLLRKTKPENTEGFVWLCFYVRSKKTHFTTGVKVNEKDWSEKQLRVLKTDPQYKEKNLIIESKVARVTQVFVKFQLEDKKPNRESFMRAYRRPSDFATFTEFARHIQEKEAKKTSPNTRHVEDVVLKKLDEKFPKLTIDEFTSEILDDFFGYLLKDRQNNQNTAYKNMTVLKKFVRAAIKLNYMDNNPFEDWKIKKSTASVTYLTEEELNKLIKVYNEGRLPLMKHRSLEIFLFLCFSSLHIGDAKSLKLEDIQNGRFTYHRIKLESRGAKPILVPVSAPMQQVMTNMVGVRKKGPVLLDVPAEQTMNRMLKEIAKEVGIDKDLTLKVGRHTFATLFLRKTKDLATLKEIMGHSEFRETLVYAHVLDEAKVEGVEKAFKGFVMPDIGNMAVQMVNV